MRKQDVVMEPPVPDFYRYGPEPIAFADWSGDTVVLHWHDGKRLVVIASGFGKIRSVMVVLIRRPERG